MHLPFKTLTLLRPLPVIQFFYSAVCLFLFFYTLFSFPLLGALNIHIVMCTDLLFLCWLLSNFKWRKPVLFSSIKHNRDARNRTKTEKSHLRNTPGIVTLCDGVSLPSPIPYQPHVTYFFPPCYNRMPSRSSIPGETVRSASPQEPANKTSPQRHRPTWRPLHVWVSTSIFFYSEGVLFSNILFCPWVLADLNSALWEIIFNT